jgi:hypothetical protein
MPASKQMGFNSGLKGLMLNDSLTILRRDYTSKHPEHSKVDKNKVEELERNLCALQEIFSDHPNGNKDLILLRIQSPNFGVEEEVFEKETLI